jgi:alkanesulfonate monooxygenase SsuD/methylene tetrahydromethanopterin reductase-like flavin-dependent oxidoreductase (luciferase family)
MLPAIAAVTERVRVSGFPCAASQEMPGRTITGSAGQLVDTLAAYGDMGFDEFIIVDRNLGETHDARIEALDRLRTEVFAQLA